MKQSARPRRDFKYRLRTIYHWLIAQIVILLVMVCRLFPVTLISELAGRATRILGPLSPRNRIGMENLRHAFPDKSDHERRKILRGMWDNLGRNAVEFVHLDRIIDLDPENPDAGGIETLGREIFIKIRDEGKPVIIFTGHLANWELLSVCTTKFGLDTAAMYRPPSNRFVAKYLVSIRKRTTKNLVASRPGVVFELMSILKRGGNIGLLMDQHFIDGIVVPFFGRPVRANPILAKLVRNFECPVHGARAVRLANGRFRLQITDEIEMPRNAHGDIDIVKATALVTNIIEGWIREHPEQWLWAHRRWRK